jgi:hypothetical protein
MLHRHWGDQVHAMPTSTSILQAAYLMESINLWQREDVLAYYAWGRAERVNWREATPSIAVF